MKITLSLLFILILSNFGQLKQRMFAPKLTSKTNGFEMISIKGGTFVMGGTDMVNDGGPIELNPLTGDECPHTVTVKDFSIGKYEVTQVQWKEIMGDNPSYNKSIDNNPVENVSWADVQIFIDKLNAKYSESFRLPTEQEWEFAAKGGLHSKNFRYAGSNNANEVAWWEGNSQGKPHPVGTLKPNELGIYDMSGNIWEWCSDWKMPYPCNPEGKDFTNISRVLRGGTYASDSNSVRARDRNGRNIYLQLRTLGFRLAK